MSSFVGDIQWRHQNLRTSRACSRAQSNTVGLQTIWVVIYYNVTLHFPAAVLEHCLHQHRQSLDFVTCLPLRHLNMLLPRDASFIHYFDMLRFSFLTHVDCVRDKS